MTAATASGHPRDWLAWMLGAAVVVVAVAFLVYPLSNGMLLAFVKNGEVPGWSSFTLANFARFFTAASYQRALWNSIYSGLAATVLATLIALPMAYAVARIAIPGARQSLANQFCFVLVHLAAECERFERGGHKGWLVIQ